MVAWWKNAPYLECILVVFELAISLWTYYIYVYVICIKTSSRVESAILLSTFHPLFVMSLWSYLKTLLTPRMAVPQEFHVDAKLWAQIEQDSNLQLQTRERLGVKTVTSHRNSGHTLNYCQLCKNIKPDRCHHCSRCKACVLRMDHHCPWLSRCVGFHNHKYFILFIHYIFVYSVFLVITSAGFLHRIWRRDYVGKGTDDAAPNSNLLQTKMHIDQKDFLHLENATVTLTTSAKVAVAVVASASSSLTATTTTPIEAGTGVSLIAGTGISVAFLQVSVLILFYVTAIVSLTPLLAMHLELMAENVTTLEQFRPTGVPGGTLSEKTFNLGSVSANQREIMGPQVWLWPFPVFTSQGDGVHFNVCKIEA